MKSICPQFRRLSGMDRRKVARQRHGGGAGLPDRLLSVYLREKAAYGLPCGDRREQLLMGDAPQMRRDFPLEPIECLLASPKIVAVDAFNLGAVLIVGQSRPALRLSIFADDFRGRARVNGQLQFVGNHRSCGD
jgi:hypothetical protein